MRIVLFFLPLFCFLEINAQENIKQEYERFLQEQKREYNDYVSQRDREYADFLKKEWELFHSLVIKRPEEKPKPQRPPVAEPDRTIPVLPGPVVKPLPVAPMVPPVVKPIPVSPGVLPETMEFDFYGCSVETAFSPRLVVPLKNVSERAVADYWEGMCGGPYKEFIAELKSKAAEMGLNDWGFYRLTDAFAAQKFEGNHRVIFCFFVLKQSGYDVRIGRSKENRLQLLMAISEQVFEMSYFLLDGKKYYCLGAEKMGSLYTYGKEQEGEAHEMVSLKQRNRLNIGACDKTRELKMAKFPDVKITLPYHSAHVAYYNDMPQTELKVYLDCPLPEETQEELVRVFTGLGRGKNLSEFVSMLLHFVQTSFDYKTDDEQFKREKYFYPEELLAYPWCDCEDRTAFFMRLVTDLVGAPTIGLIYPGHAASAVYFGETTVPGSSVLWEGRRFVICDPTYINASIGMCMPNFRDVKPVVIGEQK